MLKITRLASSNHKVTLQLDGRVTGPWVELLSQSAESVLKEGAGLVLDLENICFIDCDGLKLIKALVNRGVKQVNATCFVLEQIRKCSEDEGD
ncbi:MAG TPA: hypothetical protein VK208_18425 [Pyrinomonadaceae bacterium]|jgi:anti-anti-sigma regulatory factor|nr:hypothetical protein [Pyrinomonadaceae bacterium]